MLAVSLAGGHHARRDGEGARGHERSPRAARRRSTSTTRTSASSSSAPRSSSTTSSRTSRASLWELLRQVPRMPEVVGPRLRAFLDAPNYTSAEELAMALIEHVSPSREIPALTNHIPTGLFDNASLERWLRRSLERIAHAERLPRLRAQAQPPALRHRLRPRHRRARDLRRRREQRRHDLPGRAGLDRAADLLQARAHQRRRLRGRRRAPHRQHRRRDREGRRPDHLLQPVPPVPEPDRPTRAAAATSPTAATSRTAASRC